ncbi:hypothetical protein HDU98_008915 [Podochytrium sp. JEL0797]|nr:hypothetical protein HDU98_008915 [Podochytrium sp. JEL0797]
METACFRPASPNQDLINACIHGDEKTVLALLLLSDRIDDDQGLTDSAPNLDPLDLNACDAEGTPCLCYAACWGHAHVAALLLAAGAEVDCTDRNGWTPLIWASANNHDVIVQLLLDHGADPDRKTGHGTGLKEIVRSSSALSGYSVDLGGLTIQDHNLGNELESAYRKRRIDLIVEEMSDGEDLEDEESSQSSSTLFGSFGKKEMVVGETSKQQHRGSRSFSRKDFEDEEDDEEEQIARTPFVWDSCQLDQILVFEECNIQRILHVAISELRPTRLLLHKVIPANIVFLGARYAHYLSSPELLEEFLGESVKAICAEIRDQGDNINTLSFWLSNCTHLLYYFQKDPSLRIVTFDHQRVFAELVHELYDLVVAHVRGQVLSILEAAVLDYVDPEASVGVAAGVGDSDVQAPSGMGRIKRASWVLFKQTNAILARAVEKVGGALGSAGEVERERVWRVIASESVDPDLKRRKCHVHGSDVAAQGGGSSAGSTPTPGSHGKSHRPPLPQPGKAGYQSPPRKPKHGGKPPTPRSIVAVLNAALTAFHLANLHPDVKMQVLRQVLTALNAAIVEGLLDPRRYRRGGEEWATRRRAVAVRVNLSPLEAWVKENKAFCGGGEGAQGVLTPCFEVTRLLHVLTSCETLEVYREVVGALKGVGFGVARRAVGVYRLEEGESPIAEDVVMYIEQMEEVMRAVEEQVGREPELDLVDLDGVESGDEGMIGKTTGASTGWESVVIPFEMPVLVESFGRAGGEWKDAGRPYVPPLVLRMLDGRGLTGLEEEEGGIGLALAQRYHRDGHKVIIAGRRLDVLSKAAAETPGLEVLQGDVATEAGRVALILAAATRFPSLNVLVNNAGVQQRLNVLDAADWKTVESEIQINLSAPIHLALLFIEHVKKHSLENAAIVNVTSGLAFLPYPACPVYAGTKSALHSFTWSLRHQLKGIGIKVIEIAPPAVDTDLQAPGLHKFGVNVDVFADSVYERVKNGEEEVGYGMSEHGLVGYRKQTEDNFKNFAK